MTHRAFFLVGLLTACTDAPASPDGGREDAAVTLDAGPMLCATNADCDDGMYCTGAEVCDPPSAMADDRGCVSPGDSPCPAGIACDEANDQCGRCETTDDADGDGSRSIACGGADCDDADPNRFPGNLEVCDVGDHDEDCDPTTYGRRDIDADDEIDAACCNAADDGSMSCGADCDDTRAAVNTGAPETCNGRDDDCDGVTDEDQLLTFYYDGDGDGFGDEAQPTMMACTPSADHVLMGGDCDDTVEAVHPGAVEACDLAMVDDDCDGTTNESCDCTTGESQACPGALGLCASGTRSCEGMTWGMCSIAAVPEECNGLDDDCDGAIDDGVRVTCYADADNDGYAGPGSEPVGQCPVSGRTAFGGCPVNYTNRPPIAPMEDCNDSESTVSPASPEICNMRDDDCDAMVDDGVAIVCYLDGDRDGYASMGAVGMMTCPVGSACPSGFTDRAPMGVSTADCADGVMTTHPGALELCNGVDDDCTGVADDGMRVNCWGDGDDDGYPPVGAVMTTECPNASRLAVGGCPANSTNRDPAMAANRDCNDVNDDVHPGAVELCDGIDNDCNGTDDAAQVVCYGDMDDDTYARAGATSAMVCPDSSRPAVGNCPSRQTNRAPIGAPTIDCNDADPLINPSITEMCTVPAIDQNCNPNDEGQYICFRDTDRDGFAPTGATMLAANCTMMTGGYGGCPTSYTSRNPSVAGNRDCNDGVASVNPLATETCNGVDDNCNGVTDDSPVMVTRMFYVDQDNDDHGAGPLVGVSVSECSSGPPGGYSSIGDDCKDTDNRIYPGETDTYGYTYRRCSDARATVCMSGSFYRCRPYGTSTCTGPSPTDSYDWDCDGTTTPESSSLGLACVNAPYCPSSCPSYGGVCYSGSPPACGSIVPGCVCSGTCPVGCGNRIGGGTQTMGCR